MAPTPPSLNLTAAGAAGAAPSPDGGVDADLVGPAGTSVAAAAGQQQQHQQRVEGGSRQHGSPYLPLPPPAPSGGQGLGQGGHQHRPRPQPQHPPHPQHAQHADRDAYPDTYPGQYEFAVNLPPVHRKPPPPVPPYPGTEHLYNSYPGDSILAQDGGMGRPPGVPGSPLGVPPGPGAPGGPGGPGGAAIVVRAEEALLVLLVLVLWVAAIALFFNRWGKIRMLEPYQPKFQQHRQSCALVDISGTTQSPSAVRFRRSSSKKKQSDHLRDASRSSVDSHHRLSKLNLHSLGEPVMLTGPPGPAARAQLLRPRQNSVFVGASPTMLTALHNPPRKVKSAMDLQTLVLSEHETPLAPLGLGASSASMLPTLASAALATSPGMRRASHVPVGSIPLAAIRHHASFSHASHGSFSEQPSCSHHRLGLAAPSFDRGGGERAERAERAERLSSMDRYSHGSNV